MEHFLILSHLDGLLIYLLSLILGQRKLKVETLLPLGKLDPGLKAPDADLEYGSIASDAQLVDRLGYHSLLMEETKDDPFQILSLAASQTSEIKLGTSVAIAFTRSPFTLAQSAWTAHKISGGRFELGIGSQVKGHIRRRHGVQWHPPGPWMKDYVGALRAIWRSWQNEEPLEYESKHYNLNLNVPLFTPSPIDHAPIPIHLAAVNPGMFEVACEIAEGVRLHPVCGVKYISEVLIPRKKNRRTGEFEVCLKPLVATAQDEEGLVARKEVARERLAFYLSTPAYARAFEVYQLQDLCLQMNQLSRTNQWSEMSKLVSDELLEEIVIVALHDELASKIKDRFRSVLDRIEVSIPINNRQDEEVLSQIIVDLSTTK